VATKADALSITYLRLDKVALWDKNPKKHDLGSLIQSISKYGFRDAPIFDAKLKAIVGGNGRLTALEKMRKSKMEPPRGVKVDTDGMWLVPIQVGLAARSKSEAEAFAIDHNNITLLGGDLTLFDVARMWDAEYLELLQQLSDQNALPVSVDTDDLTALLSDYQKLFNPEQVSDEDGNVGAVRITIKLAVATYKDEAVLAIKDLVAGHEEWQATVDVA
jgi:hypothetical protein